MPSTTLSRLFPLALLVLGACGSNPTGNDGGEDAASPDVSVDASTPDAPAPDVAPDAPEVDAGADVGVDASTEDAPTMLQAPYLDTVHPSDGGLLITWENVQPDCDSIEGQRKDGLDPYAVVFSVAGSETSALDTTATQNWNYTYRLRCKRGSDYSPFSYELSANPHN